MLSVRVDTCTLTSMTEKQDLRSRLVAGRKRDGRREFNEDAVQELVVMCLRPGVSIARAAMDHDVNPNQLRRWITRYQQTQSSLTSGGADPMVIDDVPIEVSAPTSLSPMTSAITPAFVPVVCAPSAVSPVDRPGSSPVSAMALALHVRLPNGVEFDFGDASVDELTTIIQMLGRMPCSGSTKA
jgi:transposase